MSQSTYESVIIDHFELSDIKFYLLEAPPLYPFHSNLFALIFTQFYTFLFKVGRSENDISDKVSEQKCLLLLRLLFCTFALIYEWNTSPICTSCASLCMLLYAYVFDSTVYVFIVGMMIEIHWNSLY